MTIQDEFRAGAEEYARRLTADRERRDNPNTARKNNAQAFAEHLEAQLQEQQNNGTRLDINNII